VNRILASVAAGPRRVPGLAHRYPADAGLDGTPGQEAVTHQAPPAGVVDQLGMAREERRPLGFDLPRQQGAGSLLQNLRPWVLRSIVLAAEGDDVILLHGVSDPSLEGDDCSVGEGIFSKTHLTKNRQQERLEPFGCQQGPPWRPSLASFWPRRRIGWGPSGFKTAKNSGRVRSTAPALRSLRRRSAR
jgi:hypothetical protein